MSSSRLAPTAPSCLLRQVGRHWDPGAEPLSISTPSARRPRGFPSFVRKVDVGLRQLCALLVLTGRSASVFIADRGKPKFAMSDHADALARLLSRLVSPSPVRRVNFPEVRV